MNKKGRVVIAIVLGCLFIFGLIYFFTKEDKDTSLTVVEKKWIENNKNRIVDLAVLSNIPIINDNGSGMVFDFLNSLEKDTGLEFNKVSYENGSKTTADYSLEVSDNVQDNILFYRDNYVIVSADDKYYNDVTELKNLTLGSLKTNINSISDYLYGSHGLKYAAYDTDAALFDAVLKGEVDGIIIPKLDYLDLVFDNDLNIIYNIDEYYKNYVLKLGSNQKLNKILKKYFNSYKREKYQKSFNKYLSDAYFSLSGIDEKEQASFRSKRYNYGFVLDAPYEVTINASLNGFDYSIINDFAEMANVEVDFKRYSSVKNLLNDFNSNKLDVISSNVDAREFDMDVYESVPAYNNTLAIITKDNTELSVSNVSSLKGLTVLTVSNSLTEKYLKENNIEVKSYDNTMDLINNLDGMEVAAVDEYTYDYYVRSEIKGLKKIKSIDVQNDYGFLMRDTNNNAVFNEFLNFYLTFVNTDLIVHNSYEVILSSNNNLKMLQITLSALVILLISLSLFFAFRFLKNRKKYVLKLSKADKLRYVDSMTSLKNRDYLNDNIAKWDGSQVYPQSVIIIDLNNIAYINDNFGHAEGDKVIVEGAGVLIKNQLSDSEIIRTNGNEFLVFTIGHDEKTIVTYIRKLNKEFKELSHGFGAAIGYSMISDEIKTVDDAINEATIDMRNNKEEVS